MAATTGAARVESGKWKTVWLPKKASTAIAADVLLMFTAGFVLEADTTAGASDTPLVGIFVGPAITSASANYATTDLIPVLVPADPFAVANLLIDTGTPSATADIGKSFDISATGGVTVSTTTNEPVTFLKYLSATRGLFLLTLLSAPAA